MLAITLKIAVDPTCCPGGGHFGATVDFNGERYRVPIVERSEPSREEIEQMLATLVSALTADCKTHGDVRDALSDDAITLRPDTEVHG